MKVSSNSHRTTPPAHDALMFGCECALPFLTGLPAGEPGRRALSGAMSGLALSAAVALSACDGVPETTPQPRPADKVSAAFAKVDREIARAKARLNWSDRGEQRVAESENSPPR